MKRQRNPAQMKEQTKNTEVKINEEYFLVCLFQQTIWKRIQAHDSNDQKPWKQNGENARLN